MHAHAVGPEAEEAQDEHGVWMGGAAAVLIVREIDFVMEDFHAPMRAIAGQPALWTQLFWGGAGQKIDPFTGPAIDRLRAEPDVEEIVTTNTVPIAPEKLLPNMTVLSIAPLIAEAIRRTHNGESISTMFDEPI